MSDTALKIWTGIPDGSVLEVWLTSEDEDWAGGARLVVSPPDGGGTEEEWNHTALFPGPKRKKLRIPNGYTVRVRVGFTGAQSETVTVEARVVKPDSSQFGSSYAYPVSGSNPDVQRATLIAVTKKAGA